jgi:hypothetical protein
MSPNRKVSFTFSTNSDVYRVLSLLCVLCEWIVHWKLDNIDLTRVTWAAL